MLSKKDTMNAGARVIDSLRKQKRKRTETTLDEEERIKEARRLIKQEVQEKMDIEAVENSMDIDGCENISWRTFPLSSSSFFSLK